MAWNVEFDKRVEKDLKKLSKEVQLQIFEYLENKIATNEDPRRFGKALKGTLSDCWRYRIGDYRVIARIEDNNFIVFVVQIGHRSKIYD